MNAPLEKKQCEHCYCDYRWTKPAYSKFEILQVGCDKCSSIYNIIGDEYRLVGQRPNHFIFWKDLRRQWREAMDTIAASSAKKKESSS